MYMYRVHITHKGEHVATEHVQAEDIRHALKIGNYIKRTSASYNTKPGEFDPNEVEVSRIEPVGRGQHEGTTRASDSDRPTRAAPEDREQHRPTKAHYSRSGLGLDNLGPGLRPEEQAWLEDLYMKRNGLY
jgi:hypothetical protein